MWLSQKNFIDWTERLHKVIAERDAAVTQLKQQETTLAWFMHRLTQVEHERSKLIHMYTGVRVDAPTYEAAPDPEKDGASMIQRNPLNSLPSFNDVGDEEARRLGIDWDSEGTVLYGVAK